MVKKRSRNTRTPGTTTNTSTSVSPLSISNSVEPETPDTSEPELVLKKKPVAPTTVVTRSARKRVAEDEVDINVPPKRRVIADAVVVKVPYMRASKTKVSMPAFVCNLMTESNNYCRPIPLPRPTTRARGKQGSSTRPSPTTTSSSYLKMNCNTMRTSRNPMTVALTTR